MADITYTNTATVRSAPDDSVVGIGQGGTVKNVTSTIELGASASGTTVKVARIPSNARILGASKLYADDLATSGSPTLDIGLASVDSNITSDPDALNDGLAVSSAATTNNVVKDAINQGKRAWEFVSGQTTDPSGDLDVYVSVKDAATNAAGTITLDLYYKID